VTEQEWLAASDPAPMLEFLKGQASDRKLRLLLAGIARQLWHDLEDDRSRAAIEMAESHADCKSTA
jgi:hypothetical protein